VRSDIPEPDRRVAPALALCLGGVVSVGVAGVCGVVPGCTGPPSAPRAVWIASPSAQYVQLVGHPDTGDAHADNSAKAECERWSNAAVGLRNV